MLVKMYQCPKCNNKFSNPPINGLKSPEYTFYEIGVKCPYCGEEGFYGDFNFHYLRIENNKEGVDHENNSSR